VEILAWLVPAAVVTLLAMGWAAWAGRPRREESDRSEAAGERLAQALQRPHPGAVAVRRPVVRDRSTGIAVRPSRQPGAAPRRTPAEGGTRRSA
jgi:hypothetical protein